MNNLLGLLSLFLVEWSVSGSVTPPVHGSYTGRTYQRYPRDTGHLAPNSYGSFTPRLPRPNSWTHHNAPQKIQYGTYRDNYNSKRISRKVDPLMDKALNSAKDIVVKSYWTQQPRPKAAEIFPLSTKMTNRKKAPQVISDEQRSLRPKATVKKRTVSSKSRWTRNQGDHKKKKKQFIVANWAGLGLGNGLAYGLTGTPAATYSAGLGTGYGTGLSTGLTTGLGTVLSAGYGTDGTNVLGSDGVLDTRQTFGTNYGGATTSNSQSATGLSDISAAGLNSLTSEAGLNYLSNLAGGAGGGAGAGGGGGGGGGGTSDLNSLTSISQYQNNDLDILGNNANTASMAANQLSANADMAGLESLTGGTAQSQQYAGNNLGNALEGKLAVGGGSRQGIGGSMDLGGLDGINELGGNGMSDSTLQQLLGQIMTGGGSDGGGGGRIGGGGGRMSSSSNNDNMGGEMGNLDLGSLGLNLGMGNGMGNRVGNKLGNGMGNGMDNGIEDLGGIGNSMGNGMGGMGNGMGGMGSMGNGMEGLGNGMGGAGMAMGMGGMGHGMKIEGMHIGGHAAGAMGSQADINTEAEDAQPSDASDEQSSFPNLMQRPLAIAPIVPGQTVHAHASDKPKRPSYPTADFSPAEMALKVQIKANREHQKKLKELKVKLRRLREKLRRLKSEYKYNDDEEETEKSEMETLQDLKRATEQAIRELQIEAAKADKRKGVKKLIFIHNVPESNGNKQSGKTNSLENLGTDLLALIESNKPTATSVSASDGPTRTKPLTLTPAAPTTQRAQKKQPAQDDTNSLTELEKQAEQEVNFMTKKKGKAKQNALNPGLKIKIPEAVEIRPNQSSGSSKGQTRMHVLGANNAPERTGHRMSPTPHYSLPVRPQVIKTAGGQRLLNPLQLNNLAQILPEPIDNTRERKFQPSRPLNGSLRSTHAPDYFSIGCWRDQPDRALPSLEGIFPMLDGNDYKARKFAIKKCSTIAKVQGFPAFALENGGQCLGGKDILQTYNMYGASGACKPDGRGGPWSMEVYKFARHAPSRRGGIARLKNTKPFLKRKH